MAGVPPATHDSADAGLDAGNNRMDCLSKQVGDVDNYEKKFTEGKEKAASQVESFYNIATVTSHHGIK